MIQDSSPKKNHNNRFPYLLDIQPNQKSNQKVNPSPQFNFNLCAENPCRNQTPQLQLISNDGFEQQLKQRKPPKIQLQSVNFQSFKKKVQQNSFPHSFLAYTPSKESQNQHFTIENQLSTIEQPKQKKVQTQRYEILKNRSEQVCYSDMGVQNQREFSRIALNNQQCNSQLNDFIRLQLSESEESSVQSRIQTENKINNTSKLQFSTLGKIDLTLLTAKKSSRLTQIQSNQLKTDNLLDLSIKSSINDLIGNKKVTKNISQQTIATLKTTQMSSRLSQNNGFQYQHSTLWTPTKFQRLTTSEETISTRSAIKLKGRTKKTQDLQKK